MKVWQGVLLVALLAVVGCAKAKPVTLTSNQGGSSTGEGLRSTAPADKFVVSGEPGPVTQKLDAEFGQVRLVGMSVPSSVRRGEPFDIGFAWLCVSKPPGDWMIAVHIDYQGKPARRASLDHQPPLPMSRWEVGKYVRWSRPFTFAEDMPTGTYVIEVYPYAVYGAAGERPRYTKVKQSGGSTEPKVKLTLQ